MSYEKINPIQQFNFQINRVLTYGSLACDALGIREKTGKIRSMEDWETAWAALAKEAQERQQYLRAAYAYRMAEFFLKAGNPKKELYYKQCIIDFYKGFDTELNLSYERHDVPYEGKSLNCIKISAVYPKGTVLVCGGYDSFIEEFVLQVNELALRNYDVILFEGPGQGRSLRQNMYFQHHFEEPTAAVLDFFQIKECAMVGISWGGYFALRSAAFEKRIKAAVAYDVMDDGLEVMTNIFPPLIGRIVRFAFCHRQKKLVNGLVERLQKRSILADWALTQGMYITGTATPCDFYESLSQHNLNGAAERITQDVLLLAGEKDHYIPAGQFYRTQRNLKNAKSLTCRLFTEDEGGEQHCQIGNHMLAVNFITGWLDQRFACDEFVQVDNICLSCK